MRKLTKLERCFLRNCHRREKNRKVCDRIKTILMHDDGYSNTEIAQVLLIDGETVRRHIMDYFNKNKLKGESGGSDTHLTRGQTQALLNHLLEKTYLYIKDICAYVRETFGVQYTVVA